MIYSITIKPLINLMHFIFFKGFLITESYGLAIISLSLIINIALLPLYYLIEKIKYMQHKKLSGMYGEIEEIKQCYRGQERYYYIRAIHRRYNYSPFKNSVLFLAILIQIPIFISVYKMLSSYQGYQGIPFLFIKDLGIPDSLFHSGKIQLNLLPILMTSLNLLSSFLYTNESDRSERQQLYILSIFFLYFLYNSPSAVVLYWVINNLFYLIKQIIFTAYTHDKSSLLDIVTLLKKVLNWISIQKAAIIAISAVGYFYLSSYNYQKFFNIPATNFYLTASLFVLLFFGYTLYKLKNMELLNIFFFRVSVFVFAVLQTIISIYLIKTVIFPKLSLNFFIHIITLTGFTVVILISLYFHNYKPSKTHTYHKQNIKFIYLSSIIYITFSLFFWIPIAIYSSFPTEFNFSPYFIWKNNIQFTILFMMIVTIPFFIFKKIQKAVTYISSAVALCFFSFAYIIPLSFGSLEGFVLTDITFFYSGWAIYALEYMVIFLIFLLTINLIRKKGHIIFFILIAINFLTAVEGLYNYYFSYKHVKAKYTTLTPFSDRRDSVFSLSKNGKNVVIFLLDGFNSSYVTHIFKEEKFLKNQFQGFVYFPNSITTCYYTNCSMPAILGGSNYSPDKINLVKEKTLADKINNVFFKIIDSIKDKGFSLSFVEPIIYRTGDKDAFSEIMRKADVVYLNELGNYWESISKHKNKSNVLSYELVTLNALALFRSVPLAIKPFIYSQGKWLNFKFSAYIHARNNLAVLELLPTLSTVKKIGDTYKLYYSAITHRPYAISKDGELLRSGLPDPESETSYGGFNAYYSAKLSLITIARYINWLKVNKILDNTKIIIVSDHGNNYSLKNSTSFLYKELLLKLKLTEKEANRIGALLMVKDYKSNAPFTKNYNLMSNSDVYDIAMSEDSLSHQFDSRKRMAKHYRTLLWKDSEMYSKNYFPYNHIYEIRDNYFDLTKWSLLVNPSDSK